MIEGLPFGPTGHVSTRLVFGAAALGFMSQEKADSVLELLLRFGVNHLDTAARYGDSELRIAPWLRAHPDRFFLATKTGERDADGARRSLEASLERLGVDRVDLIQLHNLVDEEGWQQAMGPDGALAALVRAREEGLTRFIGVTGHGTLAPSMHLRSLERHPFASVLAPYNFTMMSQPEYAADFERLDETCRERGVALQTIKSVARRRWQGEEGRRFSWYEPLRDPEAVARGIRWVLARPGIFVNTSSDATILETSLAAGSDAATAPEASEMQTDVERFSQEPLFVRGVSDAI